MEVENAIPGTEPEVSPAGEEPVIETSTVLPSEAVRNSPEYKALQVQLRNEARRAGSLEREAAKAREAAETARLQAEASEAAAMEQQILDTLGEDGLATWQEFADLSTTDPIAAAKKWAELTGKLAAAQSSTEVPVAQQQPTPQQVRPVPRTLDAGAPLTSIAGVDPDQERIVALEQTFTDKVEQNRKEHNRMTERDRREGLMAYLEGGYRKYFRGQREGSGG